MKKKAFSFFFWLKKQMWFQSQICSWHLAWCKGCAYTAWGWSSCGARGQVTNCLNQGHFSGVTALGQRTALRETSSLYTKTNLVWSHNMQAENTYEIIYPFSIPSSPSWARNCHPFIFFLIHIGKNMTQVYSIYTVKKKKKTTNMYFAKDAARFATDIALASQTGGIR